MSHRFTISTVTVIMLVVLRLNIGWHFFSEGVKHYTDPTWTSAGTLRGATGPLAPHFQSYLPDFHGMDQWLHQDSAEKPADAAKGWVQQVESDLEQRRQAFAIHYGLNDKQQEKSLAVTRDFQALVRSWAGARRDELTNHVHQWRRQHGSQQAADSKDVPYRKQRLATDQAATSAEAASWRTELITLEMEHEAALDEILSNEQRATGPFPRVRTSIDQVDAVMTYVIMGVGALLLIGLFTRTACLVGALFLMSVVSMQPFWVSEALPTYNQLVEMFALLALATTYVGRWGGLDFFVHHFIFGRTAATKGTSDEFES